jgi:hypothetical protein
MRDHGAEHRQIGTDFTPSRLHQRLPTTNETGLTSGAKFSFSDAERVIDADPEEIFSAPHNLFIGNFSPSKTALQLVNSELTTCGTFRCSP